MSVIPVVKFFRRTKATLWIPETPEDIGDAIARLVVQNLSVNVEEWCVFHDEARDNPQGS